MSNLSNNKINMFACAFMHSKVHACAIYRCWNINKISWTFCLYKKWITPWTEKLQLYGFLWADNKNILSVLLLLILFCSSTDLCLYFLALTIGLVLFSASSFYSCFSSAFYYCFSYFFYTFYSFLGYGFFEFERVYLFPIFYFLF